MANVIFIPPKDQKPDTLRVAAYCRVSSDSADQLHSYAAQIRSYTDLIHGHDGWELVDVYADEGLTGTRMDKREDFLRMLADCRKGKIDKILVKSISRFARNTKDCLSALRELFSLGVTVQFEKENIDTGTLTTELMVSVSGALAQQESVSISQNQRISYQRRMERGEFITCKAPFGYRLTDGKSLEIVEEEAAIVRWIFDSYLHGMNMAEIAQKITGMGIPTTDGMFCWQLSTIDYLLQNEKYVGDSLCQKTYVTNIFPYRKIRNHGERNRYYVENTHPPIISRTVFERVQRLREHRAQRKQYQRCTYPLTKRISCGNCGATFVRRKGRSGLVCWVCMRHDDNAELCPVGRIAETEIHAAFLRMYHKLKQYGDSILRPALNQLSALSDALQRNNPAMLAVNRAMAQATEQCYQLEQFKTGGLIDNDAYLIKNRELEAKLSELRGERRRLLQNEDNDAIIDTIRTTADAIRNGPERLETFDEVLFAELVEAVVAESQTKIRFRLYGGIELHETIQSTGRR